MRDLFCAALICLTLCLTLCLAFYAYRVAGLYGTRTWARYPRALLSAEYDRLGTGDLILFQPRVPIPIVAAALQHELTHVGMVVKEGPHAEAALTESGHGIPADVPGRALSDVGTGVITTPLLARLKTYPGSIYLMRLRAPLSPEAAAAVGAAARARAGTEYPSEADLVVSTLLARPSPAPKMTCYEYVAELMRAARLPGAPPVTSMIRAGEEVRALSGAGPYEPICELLYDIDAKR